MRCRSLLGGRRLGIVLSDHTDEDGTTIFRQACLMGLEGIVSKRRSGRSRLCGWIGFGLRVWHVGQRRRGLTWRQFDGGKVRRDAVPTPQPRLS
jgi:hypothetical protein